METPQVKHGGPGSRHYGLGSWTEATGSGKEMDALSDVLVAIGGDHANTRIRGRPALAGRTLSDECSRVNLLWALLNLLCRTV